MAGTIVLPTESIFVPPSDPAVIFLDKKINSVHPKFGQLQPNYSTEKGKFVDPDKEIITRIEDTGEMRRQRELFVNAVAIFERNNNGIKTGVRLDISACNGWSDVIKELQKIKDNYENVKDEGVRGRTRKCLRSMRYWRQPCEQWLKAASTMNLMCEEITDSIEQIPYTIDIVYKLSKVYNTEAVQSHVSQLFVAILELLQECLNWLAKNPIRKGLSAMVKGDKSAASLEDKRAQLDKLCNRIDKYSMVGLHENVRDLDEHIKSGANVLNELHNFVVMGDGSRLKAEAEQAREESRREKEKHKKLAEEFQRLMESQIQRFLEEIVYDSAKATDDRIKSLTAGRETSWLLDTQSRIMLINSHEASHDPRSPVSLFSAMLVQSLISKSAGTILYWSCGNNIHGSTEDIVNNMVGQVLQGGHVDAPLDLTLSLMRIDVEDFDQMLSILRALLEARLKTTAVFIVIDSISFYEDRPRLADTKQLFHELHGVIDSTTGRYPLKILATSPTRCSYLGTIMDDWRPAILNVPELVEGDRMRRFSLALPQYDQDGPEELFCSKLG